MIKSLKSNFIIQDCKVWEEGKLDAFELNPDHSFAILNNKYNYLNVAQTSNLVGVFLVIYLENEELKTITSNYECAVKMRDTLSYTVVAIFDTTFIKLYQNLKDFQLTEQLYYGFESFGESYDIRNLILASSHTQPSLPEKTHKKYLTLN